MNTKTLHRSLLASVLVLGSPLALADVSGTVAVTSDYLFDGITQTKNEAALQGSIDWSAESGLYVGAWSSMVDFGAGTDSELELDTYIGYSWGGDINFDAGFVRYTYLDNKLGSSADDGDYDELYFGVNFGENTSVKYWYARDYFGLDVKTHRVKVNHNIPLTDALTLGLEYTWGDYDEVIDDTINHFRVGIGTSINNIDLDLSYHKTDADPQVLLGSDDDDLTAKDGLLVFTVTFNFGG